MGLTKYAIMVLAISVFGLGAGLAKALEAKGKAAEYAKTQARRAEMYQDQVADLVDSYEADRERLNYVLNQERRRADKAEQAKAAATAQLDSIRRGTCFDSPLDDDVVFGLRESVRTLLPLEGLSSTPSMPSNPGELDDTTAVATLACRAITEYTFDLASAFERCRSQLRAIGEI